MADCELTWAGKADAMARADAPASGRLRLDEALGVDPHHSRHRFIEGDNLPVLRLLRQELAGQVALIYIDPPYNTGGDFVYEDRWSSHAAWLSMMAPRLRIARDLLRDDGVILVSIDEVEHARLVVLMQEIFGAEHQLGDFVWKMKSGGASDVSAMVLDHEYVVAFGRTSAAGLRDDPEATVSTRYPHSDERGQFSLERLDKQNLGYFASLDFPIEGPDGRVYEVHHKDPEHKQARWRWSETSVRERYDELVFRNGSVYTKNYRKPSARPRSLLVERRFGRTRTGRRDLLDLFGGEVLDHPKPVRLLSHFVRIASGGDDLVVDFFAGSCTTAHAVLAVNAQDGGRRRFVCVQRPEPCSAGSAAGKRGLATIADVARERIRRAAAALPDPRDDEDRGFAAWLYEETT